jgi:tripartite-type tricarboxylate transporter receptor subunit TctC
MKRRDFITGLSAAAVWPLAAAEAYPSQPVRLVVGFPPGGPVDIAARTIAPWLSERLGQPFVVDNQPGDSGNNATRSVVRAAPDGYTLLTCAPVHPINATLFEGLDFDFSGDIAPVASLWSVPLVIEVNPSVPVRTIPDLISYAKGSPGKLRVGFAGYGTPQHLAIELFKMLAGVDLTLVPYLGSTPALADLMAGNIDAMFDPMPSSISHIKNGKLVPLAVTGAKTSEALPGVPVAAVFVPGYEAGAWFGLGAPKGTPTSVIETLNMAVEMSFSDTKVRARLSELGATVMPGSPAEFGAFLSEETKKYAGVIRSANIKTK